jgi:hypothetical protein
MTATFPFNVWLFMMVVLPLLIGCGVSQNVLVLRRTSIFTNTATAEGSKKINGKIREYLKDECPALDIPIHMLAAATTNQIPTNAAIALVMADVPELANSVATPRQHDDDCRAHGPLLYPPVGGEREGWVSIQ